MPPFTAVVGLFVNAEENQIRNVLAHVPLDYLQFHGDEPAGDCRIYGKRYIKAISVKKGWILKNYMPNIMTQKAYF